MRRFTIAVLLILLGGCAIFLFSGCENGEKEKSGPETLAVGEIVSPSEIKEIKEEKATKEGDTKEEDTRDKVKTENRATKNEDTKEEDTKEKVETENRATKNEDTKEDYTKEKVETENKATKNEDTKEEFTKEKAELENKAIKEEYSKEKVEVEDKASNTENTKEEAEEEESAAPEKTDFNKNWSEILSDHVSQSGNVNYQGILSEKEKLDQYLDFLSSEKPTSSWSRNKQLAYWLNAYNAFTIKKIIDSYPISSITNLANGKVWDVKWIKLGQSTYSLNQIEHEIIRPQFNDARVHFAVNCAAQSCPPLSNRAFTEGNVQGELERLTLAFINNAKYNRISSSQVAVSKIFEWYGEDFGDLKTYLVRYYSGELPEKVDVTFMPYDWALNE